MQVSIWTQHDSVGTYVCPMSAIHKPPRCESFCYPIPALPFGLPEVPLLLLALGEDLDFRGQ